MTDAGVQAFDYRGSSGSSLPGDVVVMHPDEVHDGRAGTSAGFGYRIVYVAPAAVSEAVTLIRRRGGPLPFVREPVSRNDTLARAIDDAFRDGPDALATDSLIASLAEGLLKFRSSFGLSPGKYRALKKSGAEPLRGS